jgi:hypothetical protein
MTKAEAAAFQVKWARQVDPPRCAHLVQTLGHSNDDYLAFTYYCIECGGVMARINQFI